MALQEHWDVVQGLLIVNEERDALVCTLALHGPLGADHGHWAALTAGVNADRARSIG